MPWHARAETFSCLGYLNSSYPLMYIAVLCVCVCWGGGGGGNQPLAMAERSSCELGKRTGEDLTRGCWLHRLCTSTHDRG